VNQNEGKWEIEMEADLSSSAAVTATRGTNVTCTKTGTGTYAFVIKGTTGLKMVEVLGRNAQIHGSPTGAFNARVASMSQSSNTDDVTINVTTLSNATTPVAADATAACTLSVRVDLRTIKMGSPI
jgi:hypothetical protein